MTVAKALKLSDLLSKFDARLFDDDRLQTGDIRLVPIIDFCIFVKPFDMAVRWMKLNDDYKQLFGAQAHVSIRTPQYKPK